MYDEYGFPLEWRRDAVVTEYLARLGPGWKAFEQWCALVGVRAFPADRATVIKFLLDQEVAPSVRAAALDDIAFHHEAYYWHSDANPGAWLVMRGVRVLEDGSVEVPPEVADEIAPG